MSKVKDNEINIVPVNGNVLLKQVVEKCTITIVLGKVKPYSVLPDNVHTYVVGSSVDAFKAGDEVLIDEQSLMGNWINVKSNERSHFKLQTAIGELKLQEKDRIRSKGETFDIIEYFIMHSGIIKAIIK